MNKLFNEAAERLYLMGMFATPALAVAFLTSLPVEEQAVFMEKTVNIGSKIYSQASLIASPLSEPPSDQDTDRSTKIENS